MTGIRASNTGLQNEDDDYAHQILVGDVERLSQRAAALTASIAALEAEATALQASVAALEAAPPVDTSGLMVKAANLYDVVDVPTARSNLGLGGAATLNVGTTAGTVAAGDDARITGAALTANNLSDLASAVTARTNLGLGNLATQPATLTSVATGDSLAYTGAAWENRAPAVFAGLLKLIRSQYGTPTAYLAPGVATHTFAGTSKVWGVLLYAGGAGGGGGSVGTGSGSSGGGGGGGGEIVYAFGHIASATVTVTVGAGGAGGAAGAAGTQGGNSSAAFSGGTVTATRGQPYGSAGGTSSPGLATHDPFVSIRIPGETGQRSGTVVNYNGTGNITSILTTGGLGGGRGSSYGGGGSGGSASNSGSTGQDGIVVLFES